MEYGYITVKTTKKEVWTDVEDGECPFLDFRLIVEGNYEDFEVDKYILQIHEEQKLELITHPEINEVESRINIEDVLNEK